MNASISASHARSFFRILLVLSLFAGGVAKATSPCVDTAAKLQTALNNAESQTDLYVIRVVASATPYQLGPGNDFVYLPPSTILSGGYAPGCGSRYDDAGATVIDLGGYRLAFVQADVSVGNSIEIDDLTFRNGSQFYATAGSVHPISDEVGTISLNNVRFTNFISGSTGDNPPVGLHAVKGSTELVNVQFDRLHPAGGDPCAVTILGENDSLFTANFVTADFANGNDFCLEASYQSGTLTTRIDNSIIWGSDGASPDVTAIRGTDPQHKGHDISLSTHQSIYHYFMGTGTATSEVAHIAADPHWVAPATGDYRLADVASPAVNSGNPNGQLGAPYYDIERNLRKTGSHPDRGAYESPFDDSPEIVVTSTADNGGQTLRAAIASANAFGGVHTIKFDLGACPAVIQLASPLPYVTSTMTIDGYSQPGSAPNDGDDSFDANLCVLVKPTGNVVSAFRVPNNANGGAAASLTLEGVGVGGFGQDVTLLGGTDHAIRGNQFGGVANGVDLGTSSIGNITVGVDAGTFVIGGFGSANRNVIVGAGGAVGNGINVQSGIVSDTDHCRIVNNWIGLAPDLTPAPNEYGIQLSGSGCAVVDNRLFGNTLANLWINGGHDNVVQHNIIADTSGQPAQAFGIRIDGDNNTIGSSATGAVLGTLLTNAITDMGNGGVVVTSGHGNSIRGNYIGWNGPNRDGNGMDIDLGGDGPTANGSHNTPGPNDWQPFPLVAGLAYLDHPPAGTNIPATIEGSIEGTPGSYRIDAYFSVTCSATGRAHAENHLGDATVTIPAGQDSMSFAFDVMLTNDVGNIGLTATSSAGTSEIGPCFPADEIFRSGFGSGIEY